VAGVDHSLVDGPSTLDIALLLEQHPQVARRPRRCAGVMACDHREGEGFRVNGELTVMSAAYAFRAPTVYPMTAKDLVFRSYAAAAAQARA
jgi:hypothetical protein